MDVLKIQETLSGPVQECKRVNKNNPSEFSSMLKGAIGNVSRLEHEANRSIVDMIQGKTDVTNAMVALQKADLSIRMVLAVRNKVIDAYREIMHMNF